MIKRKLAKPRPCRNCSKLFRPRSYATEQGRGLFCSIRCANFYRRIIIHHSKKIIENTYRRVGSIRKTAEALNVGWKPLFRRMKELGINTSPSALRQQSTYESCYDSNGKRVARHTLIAEQKYGRKVKKGEVVHHKDGNRQNNKSENLVIVMRKRHNKLHKQLQEIALNLFKKGLVSFKEEDGYIISTSLVEVLDGG